ncbi:MAG: chromosome partitioning protein [Treponema sp.]|jgi:phage shock protein A|nr:chromosome partitioning protein [Treponema sp.]
MEQNRQDLRGMSAGDAKEYLFHHISALKLTEKAYRELEGEIAKWDGRAALAASRAAADLAREAEAEALRRREKQAGLGAEIAELKDHIEGIRRQLPGLAARERSIDPDILEQEIRIALGKTPGGDGDAGDGDTDAAGASGAGQTARAIEDLAADAALEALKARMGMGGKPGGGENAGGGNAAETSGDGGTGTGAPV